MARARAWLASASLPCTWLQLYGFALGAGQAVRQRLGLGQQGQFLIDKACRPHAPTKAIPTPSGTGGSTAAAMSNEVT